MSRRALRSLATACLAILLGAYSNSALAIFDTEAEAKARCYAYIEIFPPGTFKCDSVLTPPVDFPPGNKYQIGYWRAYPTNGYPFEGTAWGWWVYHIVTPPESNLTVVALDPGHGSTCDANGMPSGAVGLTNFQTTPLGYLREDDLTVEFAREAKRILPTSKYKVVLTKSDSHSCPSYVDRGRVANNENAKAFISLHVNAPNSLGPSFPFGNGTSALYHPIRPESQSLATMLAGEVSSSLGVNNRGAIPSDKLAVLKLTVTEMPSVILEAARLSGTDEFKLHETTAANRVANGIRQALDRYFSK